MAQGGEVRRMIDEKLLIETMQWKMREAGTSDWNRCLDEVERFIREFPQVGGWIPVAYHIPTREDGEECLYAYILDCPMPEEGQEILVSFNGMVDMDVCCYDEGWYLDNRGDWTDVDAWMPLPEPYKESEEE